SFSRLPASYITVSPFLHFIKFTLVEGSRMSIHFARRVEDLENSSIFRINSHVRKLESDGKRVWRLDAGEPDFGTPAYIKNAAVHAIEEGYTRYTPLTGLPELKQAVRNKFARDNQ